jgi:hypothetical protein
MRVLRRHEEPLRTDDVEYVDRTVAPSYATTVAGGWTVGGALVAAVGVAVALVGLVALVRAGVDDTWFRPVVQVLDANHTALLGALELGAGALLILAGALQWRGLAALVGLAMIVGGVFGAIETSEVSRQLAIEDWWAWTGAGAGALVALAALIPTTRGEWR